MLRVCSLDGEHLQVGGPELLLGQGLKWVDLQPPDSAALEQLKARFGLHALEIEDIEERVFNDPSPTLMQEVFGFKRTLARVRRVLSPQRDVVGTLARRGLSYVNESTSIYFRDV